MVIEHIKDGFRGFIVPLQVLEDQVLSVNEKMVYIVLRSFVNAHKSEAWPKVATIVRLSGISKSSVIRAISKLEESGYIAKQSNYKYNTDTKKMNRTSNIYTLDLPELKVSQGNPSISVTQTPTQCHTDTTLVSQGHPKDLDLNELNRFKDDDDRRIIIDSVFESYKDRVTQEQFAAIIATIMKRKGETIVHDLFKYLFKGVETELSKANQSKEKQSRPRKQSPSTKKPALKVVSRHGDGSERELTEDELEAAYELARKLEGGVSSGV